MNWKWILYELVMHYVIDMWWRLRVSRAHKTVSVICSNSAHNIKPSVNQANKNTMPIIKTRYFRLLLSYKVGSRFWERELREKTENDSWKRDSWEKPLCATKTDRRTDRHCDTIKLLSEPKIVSIVKFGSYHSLSISMNDLCQMDHVA